MLRGPGGRTCSLQVALTSLPLTTSLPQLLHTTAPSANHHSFCKPPQRLQTTTTSASQPKIIDLVGCKMDVILGDNRYWTWEPDHHPDHAELHKRANELGCTRDIGDWTKEKLTSWLRRRKRELPIYEQCSDAELATFIRQRNLAISPPAKETALETQTWSLRTGAIEVLEAADDAMAFHRFLDLPPELRKLVYEWHVKGFPEAIILPAKPPIAQTCHLIREEVLPVFYSQLSIEIFFELQTNDKGNRIRQRNETNLFLLYMRPKDYQYLNMIDIAVMDEDSGSIEVDCSVALMKTTSSYRVAVGNVDRDAAGVLGTTDDCPHKDILERRLKEVLDGMVARGGTLQFTAYDIYSMRYAIERGWREFDDWRK
ncbi:hypothetical protein BDY17DRAFT_35246 [Neohortaea acidophila]|uniref:Uncharacterized protein n=1 Tax=Neohortaea acidophila TaxID=245834 RepID=A0A6A6PJM3_9PEZI|nr:uncharacterized protein BDY17DRAFT_35246 [Neohortaea acidophila]KAF2480268.1 hypothetical protein BDY17DRAFT_35246 [Neohortaea acidophila]